MRNISGDIAAKLSEPKQTKANKADPWAKILITRPTVPLTNQTFLERSVAANAVATDVSIATCHPRRNHSNTDVWIAYSSGGQITVIKSPTDVKPRWTRQLYSLSGNRVSIAFDGKMPGTDKNNREFVTESEPWLFWVDGGALYTRKMGTTDILTLALSNVTDVSATRATWSEIGRFDFGLCVFFVMNGSVYYRQLIDGEWKDAEIITSVPSGITWVEVSSSRTWDYRIALQLKDTTGTVYELFSQYMGFGANNSEHINVDRIDGDGNLLPINHPNTINMENIDVENVSVLESEFQWGLPVVPISVENVDDGTGNYGLHIRIILDHPCDYRTVASNEGSFTLVDEYDQIFYSCGVDFDETGNWINIEFSDFNTAYGTCILSYTPGSIKSPPKNSDVLMLNWSVNFVPTGLIMPIEDPPVPFDVWNE